MFLFNASCYSHMGHIRVNNEDNFFFLGDRLAEHNLGMDAPISHSGNLKDGAVAMAVFDGMGGEDYGEAASYAAASTLCQILLQSPHPAVSEEQFLIQCCNSMNQAVVDAGRALRTAVMGTTAAILLFSDHQVFACNVGDSRIFRLRGGLLEQLSVDHTDAALMAGIGAGRRRPRLIQWLGMNPEEVRLVPSIARFPLEEGDVFLICSDGLTDMVRPEQIAKIMAGSISASDCTNRLVQAALAGGGKDNITVIAAGISK